MPAEPKSPSLSRRARRAVAYGLGIGMAAPRTIGFAAESLLRRGETTSNENGSAHVSPALLAQVAMDELILAAMKTPGRFPRREQYLDASKDLLAAYELFRHRGWDSDPRSYHQDPEAPDGLVIEPAFLMGRQWQHIWFESGFEPRTEDPSRSRWAACEANRTMHGWIRRSGAGKPWVVCVHPFGTGQSRLSSFLFKADALAESLDVNVALVVLPLHGCRGGGWIAGGSAFMTYNPVDILLGLTQSVWDVRRFLAWLREREKAAPVALYGVSLGAHVSAIVAGMEDDLAGVVAGVPTCDLLEVFLRHVPKRLHPRAREHKLVGEESRSVLRATSPLTFPALVPKDRLFIFAATGDRMSPPEQAKTLWNHWGKPEIRWFDANHTAFMWNRDMIRFVRDSLRSSLDLPRAA